MNGIDCGGAHAARATSRHWGALAAAGLLLCAIGCAAPAKELAGPATAQRIEGARFDAEYVTTSRREGARQPFLLFRPQHPVASVILFTGGDGVAGISPNGIKRPGNFLVRTRFLFAEHDLLVAVVDPPSDRANLSGFRTSQAHALDIKGVIAYLREQAPVPVWLVGTSYGTVSAIMVADWLADEGGPDGVVLTSSLFIRGRQGDSVFDANPARIHIPLLLVHNRSDRCHSTPFHEADTYVKRMYSAHPVELIAFDGGGPVKGDWCEPYDYHGYPGLEPQVVDAIAKWMLAHGKG
jgi:pimeloyl-ACP methyl ester carboxylesterase